MKRRGTISFALVLFAALIMSFAGSVQAAPGKAAKHAINSGNPSDNVYTGKVTWPLGLKLYNSKDTKDYSGVIVPGGKIVSILARESGGWYKVSFEDKTGYMIGRNLSDNDDIMYTTADVQLRAETGNAIVTTVPYGSKVEVIDREIKDQYLVNFEGKVGYAPARNLSIKQPEKKQEETKKETQPSKAMTAVISRVLKPSLARLEKKP